MLKQQNTTFAWIIPNSEFLMSNQGYVTEPPNAATDTTFTKIISDIEALERQTRCQTTRLAFLVDQVLGTITLSTALSDNKEKVSNVFQAVESLRGTIVALETEVDRFFNP